MKPKQKKKPHDEGYEAFFSGKLTEDCPYPQDSEAGQEWQQGYERAERQTLDYDLL